MLRAMTEGSRTPSGGRDFSCPNFGHAVSVVDRSYDRTSPNAEIVSRRITTLGRLAIGGRKKPTLIITTVNAILQRVPPRSFVRGAVKSIVPGQRLDPADLVKRLGAYGYDRSSTVMEPGEFAQRGDILDLFPLGRTIVRLDFSAICSRASSRSTPKRTLAESRSEICADAG